ncbi:MAG: hypothetical protein EBY89_00420, partial [Actinobacteria bacterium]|nr:hypothetical protein [Actinomycetota bacterium]
LYVFDKRLVTDFAEGAALIGSCDYCGEPTKDFYNCSTSTCRKRTLVCTACANSTMNISCTLCTSASLVP